MSLNHIQVCTPDNAEYDFKDARPTSIAEMYWYHLQKYETGKIRKVLIFLKEIKSNGKVHGLYGTTGSITDTCVLFDFEAYHNSNNFEKKKMLLEAVHSGMNKLALDEGWKIEPLNKAYEACLAKNLEHSFFMKSGKTKSSPNRKFKVGFFCEWELEMFKLSWVIYDKKGQELKRKQFIKTHPGLGVCFYYVEWKWLDNNNVYFDESKYNLGEDFSCTIDLEEDLKEFL